MNPLFCQRKKYYELKGTKTQSSRYLMNLEAQNPQKSQDIKIKTFSKQQTRKLSVLIQSREEVSNPTLNLSFLKTLFDVFQEFDCQIHHTIHQVDDQVRQLTQKYHSKASSVCSTLLDQNDLIKSQFCTYCKCESELLAENGSTIFKINGQ